MGLCHRCKGFYRLGKNKKVLERVDTKKRVDRKTRNAVRKGMETKHERRVRKEVSRRLEVIRRAKAA